TGLIIVRGISDFADERKSLLDSTATHVTDAGAWRRYAACNAVDLFAALVASPQFPWPDPPADASGGDEVAGQAAGGAARHSEASGRTEMHATASEHGRIYQVGQGQQWNIR